MDRAPWPILSSVSPLPELARRIARGWTRRSERADGFVADRLWEALQRHT